MAYDHAAYMREYYRRPEVHERWLARVRERRTAKAGDRDFVERERERGREKYRRLYQGKKRTGARHDKPIPERRRARALLRSALLSG